MSDIKSELLNGAAAAAPTPSAQPFTPNPSLLKLAQDLVEAVSAGRITTLCAVTISPLGQMSWPGCGNQMAEVMIGAEMMRDDIKHAMRQGGKSKIIRTGG